MATTLRNRIPSCKLTDGTRSDRAQPSEARALMSASWVLKVWLERARQRRALLRLSDALLEDIGISRAEAWHAGTKPFWRA